MLGRNSHILRALRPGIAALLLLSACSAPKTETSQESTAVSTDSITYRETYRPRFHFSPPYNWTNDPNGLVYHNGEYHLFYQYNPYGNKWGHMSWGHAVSPDLLHWQHLPVAIEEYNDRLTGDSTMIFSGSAVVDANNTSGFFEGGQGGIVAVYTSHVHRAGQQLRQHQSIAYSQDNGRTFTRYEQNPVLDIQRKDFRDPKVFWYEPKKYWVMAAVIPDEFKVHLYSSTDLKSWKFLSSFGPLGDTAKIWECPDLIEVPYVDNSGKKKWVMIVSNSHPQGPDFVGMQYFVGTFDGTTFKEDKSSRYPLYLDYGKDYYAAVTYNNSPDGRVILLGWANNWAYGGDIPTSPWRSAMAIPRELYLKDTPGGTILLQQPIREVMSLRGDPVTDPPGNENKSLDIDFDLTFKPSDKSGKAGLILLKGDGEETYLGYDVAAGELYLDRTRSGNTTFHKLFSSVEKVKVPLNNGTIKMRILIDQSIIEVFVNGGEQVISSQVFQKGSHAGLETFAEGVSPGYNLFIWTTQPTMP